jgi:low temperature requirement protein LtrA
MIAGIVLFALGVKKTIGDIDEPLKTDPAIALCGGVALYLLAQIAFRPRNVGSLNRPRLVAAAACLALIPVTVEVEALAAAIAAICTLLVTYEAIRYREARARVRNARA